MSLKKTMVNKKKRYYHVAMTTVSCRETLVAISQPRTTRIRPTGRNSCKRLASRIEKEAAKALTLVCSRRQVVFIVIAVTTQKKMRRRMRRKNKTAGGTVNQPV